MAAGGLVLFLQPARLKPFGRAVVNDHKKIISLLEGRTPSEMDDPENWLTPEETMKELTVCERTLYTLRENGELLARKKGRRYHYFKPSIFKIRNYHIK